jgi:hypothetical protein
MGGRADVPEFDYRGPGGLANEGELEDSILALSEEKIAPRREHREPIDADLLHHFGRTCAERG